MKNLNFKSACGIVSALLTTICCSFATAQTFAGTATISGTNPMFHTGSTTTVGSGDVALTFTSTNLTYTVTQTFGGSTAISASTLANELCAQMTVNVKCTGVTVDASGYYNLSLTASQTFLASASEHIGTTGGRGTVTVTGGFNISAPNWGTLQPKYYVLELLYAAPGNTSSAGFTNGTTQSTTSTIGSNFTARTTDTFVVSLGFGGDKVSIGASAGAAASTNSSESFQESLQTNKGSTIKSTKDPIDHTQDQFWLLLNPQVTLSQTASGAVNYTTSTINDESPDVVNVSVAEMQNPSLIPLSVLETQTDPITGNALPGLKNVCAKPLADNACTTSNACGCTPNDFSAIIPLDELLSHPSVNPASYDSSRFAYVQSVTLEGPACASCDPVTNTFTITDSSMASQTTGGSQEYSVGFSAGYSASGLLGIVSINQMTSTTFTWTNSYSFGESSGTSHSETVTLGTSAVGCYENYDVYQDGEFHTFAYYPATPSVPSC